MSKNSEFQMNKMQKVVASVDTSNIITVLEKLKEYCMTNEMSY